MEQQVKEFDSLIELLEDLEREGIGGVQRYRAINGFISLKARYRDIPVSGTLELTPFCNLDCKMCYVHLNKNQIKEGERLLTVDEWKEIIRQAVDAGMMFATLTGGECLTYPGFKEIYLYLMSLGVHPDVFTNGKLLTVDMVQFFAEHPPGVIQVSLYGSNEDAYERVTGHRAFQQVIDGIKMAKQAGLNVYIAITPNRYMQDDAADLLACVHSLEIPYVIGTCTLQARPETEREFQDYAIDTEAYFSIHRMERDYYTAHSTAQNLKMVPQCYPKERKKLAGLQCGGGHSAFQVTWRGELTPCTAFSSAVHYSILARDFDKAWQLVRDAMANYRTPRECENCENSRYCDSCPGEISLGELNGSVNKAVCKRAERYVLEMKLKSAD